MSQRVLLTPSVANGILTKIGRLKGCGAGLRGILVEHSVFVLRMWISGLLRRSGLVCALAVVLVMSAVAVPAGAAAPARSGSAALASTPVTPTPVPGRPSPRVPHPADRRDPSTPGRSGAPSAPVPIGSWLPLGPAPIGPPFKMGGGFYGGVNSGRITAVATLASGTHPGRVVVGTAGGGVWTSDNSGTTWTARTDQAASLAVGAVAVDPANSNHLIAGTGESNNSGDSYPGFGVLSSTDGGDTWAMQDPGSVFDGLHIGGVAVDPANAARMFAATDGGLFVTTNGGGSWAKPTSPSYASVDGNINTVVINPSTPSTVYIGGGAATVATSTDGGLSWAPANTGIGVSGLIIAVALAPSSPTTMYVSVGSSGPVALFKSTDGAAHWSAVTAAPDYTGQGYSYGGGSAEQGWYDNTLAIDPTNANHVLAGGIALVETTDGGSTWSNVNGQTFFGGGTNKLHPDHHGLAFRADGTVWVGNDGGVFLYDPVSHAVTNSNGNLNITQFYYGFNEVGGQLLAGSQDNGSATSGSSSVAPWTGLFSGDGGPSAITPNNPQTQFIQANQDLYITTDAFTSDLTDITPPALGLFTPPMAVAPNTGDPANPTVFYGGPDLYRTTNPSVASPTWTQVTSDGSFVSAITVTASNPAVVYVGFTDGTIEVSTDAGVTFTPLAAQPFTADTYITGLSIDPSNPKAVTASVSYNDTRYVSGFPHVAQYSYTTSPGSGSWTVITGNLPSTAAVSRVVYDNGALIAATDAGVYATGAPSGGATSWSLVGSGLPKVQVQDLFVDPVSNNLYAVTHGRGSWKLPAPVTTVTLLSDFNGDGKTDLVARDAAGVLWLYPGNGAGAFPAAPQMGTGWDVFTAIVTPGDVTGDAVGDILARDSAGRLWLYPGNGKSGVSTRRQIGSGWNVMNAITNAADLNGAGGPDLLARDTAGNLWLYPLSGNAVFGARTRIGTGWNGYAFRGPGDLSGDGRADILARDPAGALWLYRGDGAGHVTGRSRVGTGWLVMNGLATPGNWDRVYGNDILARDISGRLWLYPGTNTGGVQTRRQVGAGWQGFSYIG